MYKYNSLEGLVLNKNIIKSSGIKEADEVVLMSIDKGAPYPKIQEDYTGESITIELTYEYAINKKLYEKNHFESKYYKLIQQTLSLHLLLVDNIHLYFLMVCYIY